MSWVLKEYGREVTDFLGAVATPAAVRILRDLRRMSAAGHTFRGDTKSLGSGLLELRVQHAGMAYRLIYVHHDGGVIFLVCFVKKTQKTPVDKIELATKRYADVLRKEVTFGNIKLN